MVEQEPRGLKERFANFKVRGGEKRERERERGDEKEEGDKG